MRPEEDTHMSTSSGFAAAVAADIEAATRCLESGVQLMDIGAQLASQFFAEHSAAGAIDWGYGVKLPVCQALDKACGLEESSPASSTWFLQFCYGVRRPGLAMMDVCLQASFSRIH